MLTNRKFGLLLAAVTSTTIIAHPTQASTTMHELSAPAAPEQCKPTSRSSGDEDTRATLDAIRNMKKDGGAGVPLEAQALLDQMTAMFENDDSRGSAEMADAMREFAGGRAPKRQRC